MIEILIELIDGIEELCIDLELILGELLDDFIAGHSDEILLGLPKEIPIAGRGIRQEDIEDEQDSDGSKDVGRVLHRGR